MKKVENLELTKELYLEISADKTERITQARAEKDDVICKIEGNIQQLKELRDGLKEIKKRIKVEKKTLRKNKGRKFALTRELSIQNIFFKKINKAYINGEETIDLTRFYTAEEQKIR